MGIEQSARPAPAVDPAPPSRVKGAGFREFVRHFETEHGSARLHLALGSLPESMRDRFDPSRPMLSILPSEWYPSPVLHALLDAMLVGLSAEERDALVRGGTKAIMDGTLRGVYRFLFRLVATPKRFARNVQSFWSAYHDSGRVTASMLGTNETEGRIADWSGHHPFMCETITEAVALTHQAMGLANVACTRTRCVAKGDAECGFRVRWG